MRPLNCGRASAGMRLARSTVGIGTTPRSLEGKGLFSNGLEMNALSPETIPDAFTLQRSLVRNQ